MRVTKILALCTVFNGIQDYSVETWTPDAIHQRYLDRVARPVSVFLVLLKRQRLCLIFCDTLHPSSGTYSSSSFEPP